MDMQFSSEDADYLIEYYKTNMIGGKLDKNGLKVGRLMKKSAGPEKYYIWVLTTEIGGVFQPKKSIEEVAKLQGLLSPEDVLKQKG